jgi:hypothetical protein
MKVGSARSVNVVIIKCCHPIGMLWSHVTVGRQNQFATVAVALPLSDNLDVHTPLDRSRDEHPPECSVCERGKAEPLASVRQRLSRLRDRKQQRGVRLALAQFLSQRAQFAGTPESRTQHRSWRGR